MNFYWGTGVALVTPFNEKGEIDEIKQHIGTEFF